MIEFIKKHIFIYFTLSCMVIPFVLGLFSLPIVFAYILALNIFNYKYKVYFKLFEKEVLNERIYIQPEFKFKSEQWGRKGKWKMAVGKHPDGRILLMANEFGLKPIVKDKGVWGPVIGEEINEFIYINDKTEQLSVLKDALLNYEVVI